MAASPTQATVAAPTTRDKVTGAIAWTLVPRAVQILGSVFTSILIVRSLQYEYGVLSVLRTPLAFLVVLCSFGLGQALNRFVPELRVTGQGPAARALLWRSLWLQSAIWFLVSVVLLASRGFLRAHFPIYADLLILAAALSIAEVICGTFGQYAIAIYRARDLALASGAGTLALAGGTALLLHLGLRIPGVLTAAAIGFAVNTAVIGILLYRRTAKASGRAPAGAAVSGAGGAEPAAPRHFSWHRLLAYAVPWIPNNILNYVIWRQSETFLLGIYRTSVEAGFFDLAYKLPQMVLEFVPASVYPLVLAGFAETAAVAKEKMPEVIAAYYRLLFFLVAPLSVFGLAMGDVLLARMYGASMAQAGHYCQAFFIIFTLSFFGTPLSMTVYVVEKVWVNLVLNVAYGIATVGLDLLLIPRLGLLGATIPTATVTALTPFVRYLIARRYLKGIYIPWGFIGRAYLASTPLLGLFWAKVWVRHLGSLAVCLILVVAVMLLSFRLFRVMGKEERDLLRRSHFPGRKLALRIL